MLTKDQRFGLKSSLVSGQTLPSLGSKIATKFGLAYPLGSLAPTNMADLAQAVSFSKQAAAPKPAGRRLVLWQTGIVLGLGGWLYASILMRLAQQWWSDPNFSHGFFVPAFSLFVVWQDRLRLATIRRTPSTWGLPIILFSMSVLILGVFGAELFLSRVSLIMLIAGMIVFFWGWGMLRGVLFPLLFMILMVPIPAIVFSQITFPLQILASKLSATILPVCGVPVFREGNVINLPAMPLEVAQACSGIRSLLSLTTLAIMYGYLMEKRPVIRVALALASIPIAVAANGLRIVGTGLLVQYWDPDKAEGFFHLFSGWLIFVVSLLMLFALHQSLRFFSRPKEATA